MMKKIKRLIRRRKAVSPVIAALLLIALTVSAVALVYYIVMPLLNRSNFYAEVIGINDTDRDSRYDKISVILSNAGTANVEVLEINVWTCPRGRLNDQDYWVYHKQWNFTSINEALVLPGEPREADVYSLNQIHLSYFEETLYRLEIYITGEKFPYMGAWTVLNDQIGDVGLKDDFEKIDLQAAGFEGSIDVPGWSSNNYNTTGGLLYGPFIAGQIAYLPVIDEDFYIPFYITGKIVIFHSTNGNLTNQPTVQQINRTTNPFRASNLYVLGLAGSWGDEFAAGATALTLNVTYTDGSSSIWDLGHDYIDDWWYNSNRPRECVSVPYGKITEIDLGRQSDSPTQPIHTHTARFGLDLYKYVQFITFVDPGNDASGPHLLSITVK
ncbi:MAG: archaellin/type IV pilin N-terminal domain-containing protein [Candidatus Heimdallarchaeota archaeon]